jgi:uncharacterized protein with FMN-binding domain
MRRAAAAVVVTTAGLVGLLEYKSGSATTRVVGGHTRTSTAPASPLAPVPAAGSSLGVPMTPSGAPLPSPPSAGGPPVAPVPASATPAGPAPARNTTPPTPTSQHPLDGPVVDTRYGPVQVEITVSGSRVVDVQALQLPNDRRRSVAINDYAAPILRREALAAQSAQINTVSGASVTSNAYAQSLQAALSTAGKS